MSTATPDTSVVVAGLCSWHPDHDVARATLARRPRPLAHVMLESYSVLTRLPGSRRVPADLARAALAGAFATRPIGLSPASVPDLLRRLAAASVGGGATYDALVGETARRAGLTLVSLDRRAETTYELVGASVEWLA